jgi:hypothetical protein
MGKPIRDPFILRRAISMAKIMENSEIGVIGGYNTVK